MEISNIILTGFMGCGKTTVGKLLAKELGLIFVDTDQLIEEDFGMTIPEIFATYGESRFRIKEREIAATLSKRRKQVVATGGGLMLDPQNQKALGKNGRVFCLIASPDEIFKRVSGQSNGSRPLLEGDDPRKRINQLIEERRKSYQKFYQIDTSRRTPEEVAALIKSCITKPLP